MTRRLLIQEMASDLQMDVEHIKKIVMLYEQKIADYLYAGETVKLPNFARFEVLVKKGSARYSIAAQSNVYIPTKYRVRIVATGDLKESIENQKVSRFDKTKNDVDGEEGDK